MRVLLGAMSVKSWLAVVTVSAISVLGGPLSADMDRSLYMTTDELKPGMKGFGKTVMSGATIETFGVEVISVMHNAFYAKQDVILIRCSGLNLEHSGVIGGMSGSPCYIRDEQGRERLIGAVAYGWTFSKDPICGVQPIAQMLDVANVRKPKPETRPSGETQPVVQAWGSPPGGGFPLQDWILKAVGEPIPADCRLSVLSNPSPSPLPDKTAATLLPEGLRPLEIPLSMSSLSQESMTLLGGWFKRHGLTPLAAGGAPGAGQAPPGKVQLEPGAALCVALVTGDIFIDAVGTCTAVIGDRVLGFGHQFMGTGPVEYPLATGFIHTVIPSVMRSNKLGGALEVVGTLWGDEATAVFGTVGRLPAMVPMEVVVNDLRGRQTFHYNVVHEDESTGAFLATCLMESIYAHNELPIDHTVRHNVEVDFGELGTYTSSNVSSQSGVREAAVDLMYPVQTLLNPPLAQKARVKKVRAEITIEDKAQRATIYHASLPKTVYKPGETVTAAVRWSHYRKDPLYTDGWYSLKLPDDLPDGDYEVVLCSNSGHLTSLNSEKPHLFRAETLSQAMAAFNLMGRLPGNVLYMRLNLKQGGIAYKQLEMPDLPASRRKILSDTKLASDLNPYTEALVAEHKTDFVVLGKQALPIRVRRHPDS
ncbi:MAG TPA: hypothetical protein PLL20_09235 [Phycisphaerae bacterium]|nr:hypothetical protein [Phycisphaerae bacterium]